MGRAANGVVHICDEDGAEPTRERLVYFEQPARPFEYHKAPEKTASCQHPSHDNWTALAMGYLDEDGYLYLTDRKAFMIILGKNVYPQQVEDALVLHPEVADVAAFGVPDPDLGEAVKAVVEVAPGVIADDALEARLVAFTREHLAAVGGPVDFIDEMPRLPTGKLHKPPPSRPLLGQGRHHHRLKFSSEVSVKLTSPGFTTIGHRGTMLTWG